MIVYLDLDRTVFKTNAGPIWQVIDRLYPSVTQITGGIENRSQYYENVEDLYFYDLGAQLRASGEDPEEVFQALMHTELADGRYEYEGTTELIAYLQSHGVEVRILTFGPEDSQRFKAALCPSLREIPIVITQRPKYEYFEDTGEECWLVDDKPVGFELPGNVSFIQVNHESAHILADADWPVCRNLSEVRDFFEDALS